MALALALALAPAPAPAPAVPADPEALARAIQGLPRKPTLATVQRAAVRRARLDGGDVRRWLRRARAASLLPTLTTSYDLRLDRGWSLDREPGVPDALQNDLGNVTTLRLKATWELDRAVFDPDELRAARAALDLVDWRERVIIEVTQLYFERQRLLLQRELSPPTDMAAAIEVEVRLAEVEGILAGLTGIEDSWTTHRTTRATPPSSEHRRP